jgi:hypothetical protein
MRRLLAIVAALFGLGIAMATPAFADSPHFLYANSSISSSTGALNVDFKEAGLGTTVTTEQVTLSVATAAADYQCFNNGGNHPKAGNKEHVEMSLTTSGTFPVRNGQTTGTISAGPPSQGAFTCPSGQSLFLQSVTYSGIFVTGSAGDSLEATPDPISSGPIHLLIG